MLKHAVAVSTTHLQPVSSPQWTGMMGGVWCGQVVHSMCMQAFEKGDTILHQGAMVGEDDFMYLLESGEVDVVISGGQSSSEDHKVGCMAFPRSRL